MRLRTGHGPNDWTESTPASTGSSRLGGELVQGGPGSYELARIAHRNSKRPSHEAAARRASRARAREARYNTVVGVSDVSATMRDDAASGAYSTGGRVAASTPGVRR